MDQEGQVRRGRPTRNNNNLQIDSERYNKQKDELISFISKRQIKEFQSCGGGRNTIIERIRNDSLHYQLNINNDKSNEYLTEFSQLFKEQLNRLDQQYHRNRLFFLYERPCDLSFHNEILVYIFIFIKNNKEKKYQKWEAPSYTDLIQSYIQVEENLSQSMGEKLDDFLQFLTQMLYPLINDETMTLFYFIAFNIVIGKDQKQLLEEIQQQLLLDQEQEQGQQRNYSQQQQQQQKQQQQQQQYQPNSQIKSMFKEFIQLIQYRIVLEKYLKIQKKLTNSHNSHRQIQRNYNFGIVNEIQNLRGVNQTQSNPLNIHTFLIFNHFFKNNIDFLDTKVIESYQFKKQFQKLYDIIKKSLKTE